MLHDDAKDGGVQDLRSLAIGLAHRDKIGAEEDAEHALHLEQALCQWRALGRIGGGNICRPAAHDGASGQEFQRCRVGSLFGLDEHFASPGDIARPCVLPRRGLAITTEHGSSAPCLQPQKYSGHWRLDGACRHLDDRGPMNMVPPFADPPPTLAPADWLLQVGRLAQNADELLGGLCDLLVARGLPLERVGLHGRVLHPQLAGVRLLWRRGIASEETLYAHDTVE